MKKRSNTPIKNTHDPGSNRRPYDLQCEFFICQTTPNTWGGKGILFLTTLQISIVVRLQSCIIIDLLPVNESGHVPTEVFLFLVWQEHNLWYQDIQL